MHVVFQFIYFRSFTYYQLKKNTRHSANRPSHPGNAGRFLFPDFIIRTSDSVSFPTSLSVISMSRSIPYSRTPTPHPVIATQYLQISLTLLSALRHLSIQYFSISTRA